MKLHILYSGMAEGGAQKFAFALARNQFVTSTISKGNFKTVLESNALSFIDIESLDDYKFDVIVMSDMRALLFYVKNSNRLKARSLYFIPHTDKILRLAPLIVSICSFFKITILPTTRCQKLKFQKKLWYSVGDIPDFVEENSSINGVIYFGRFEGVKRLQKLIDDFNASSCPQIGLLTLQGSGEETFERRGPNVRINRTWLAKEELDSLLSANRFNIVYSKTEGLSLSSLEAVGKGLTPLFYSKDCCTNYGLDAAHLVQGPRDFRDLLDRKFIPNVSIIERLKKDSEDFSFLYG